MADIFDVLSDETRRRILELLLDRATASPGDAPASTASTASTPATSEASVSDIVMATGLPQPTVSKQLKVLRDAHLVTVREVGQHRLYRLSSAPLRSADAWLTPFRSRDAAAPAFLVRGARMLGIAVADLLGKAPWR